MRLFGLAPPLLLLLLACVACATPLSVEEERRVGARFEEQVRGELKLVRDETIVAYVRGVGERIVAAAGPQPFDYRFHVVDSEVLNAFAGPAGRIYVHTETVLKARNLSELAGVMAHEVGHVARRHVAQNYSRAQNTGVFYSLGVVAAAVLGGPAAASAAELGGGLAAMAYLNSFGRDAEREADAFAIDVLPRAGIDPRGLVGFFETLVHEGGSSPAPFLSSHPATRERIESTLARIERMGLPRGLQVHDGGRLEIIQSRIRLVTGRRAR